MENVSRVIVRFPILSISIGRSLVDLVAPVHSGMFSADLADGPELVLLHIALHDQLQHPSNVILEVEVGMGAILDHVRYDYGGIQI